MAKKTVQEITESVLGYGFAAGHYTSYIKNWLDEAQRTIFRRSGLRLKASTHEFTTTSEDDSYELPEDFGSVISLHTKTLSPKRNLEQIFDIKTFDELDDTNGVINAYIIHENNIRLYPKPDGEYEMVLRYNIIPSAIAAESSANPSIVEDYYYLLEEYILYKAYMKEGDIEMANKHKEIFDTSMINFAGDMNTDINDKPKQVSGSWSLGY